MNKDLAWSFGSFVAVSIFIALVHYAGGWFSGFEGTMIGAAFIIIAIYAAGKHGISDRDLGLVFRPVSRVFMPTFWVILIIFPLFSVGYLGWMHLWGHKIRVPVAPFAIYSVEMTDSLPGRAGRVNIHVTGNELAISFFAKHAVTLNIAPHGCDNGVKSRKYSLQPGRHHVDLGRCTGFTVSSQSPILQAPDKSSAKKVTANRTLWSLLLLFFTELFGVALPEELFYRGYIQAALKRVFKKRVRILGASMGWEVVLTAFLFAIGHLITVPHVFRLAVFFPGLLFGYLRERSDSLVAPIIIHALSNCLMFVVQGFVLWG